MSAVIEVRRDGFLRYSADITFADESSRGVSGYWTPWSARRALLRWLADAP